MKTHTHTVDILGIRAYLTSSNIKIFKLFSILIYEKIMFGLKFKIKYDK